MLKRVSGVDVNVHLMHLISCTVILVILPKLHFLRPYSENSSVFYFVFYSILFFSSS